MTRLRRYLSSLIITTTLTTLSTAAHATPTAPAKPVPAALQVQVDRAAVRAKLAERRAEMIARFLAYREARVYPWNRSFPGAVHLWFDDAGNLCAAATLISKDWGRASTVKVGETDRFIALANVKRGELADWMLTSGLTHHEIVAIQAPGFTIEEPALRGPEIERLHALYVDVERQLRTLGDENLDLATDALLKRPDLARRLLAGKLPGPGKYHVAEPANPGAPVAPAA